jgi:hypothetical protein
MSILLGGVAVWAVGGLVSSLLTILCGGPCLLYGGWLRTIGWSFLLSWLAVLSFIGGQLSK